MNDSRSEESNVSNAGMEALQHMPSIPNGQHAISDNYQSFGDAGVDAFGRFANTNAYEFDGAAGDNLQFLVDNI